MTYRQSVIRTIKKILKMQGQVLFLSLVLIPDAWNVDVMAGALSGILDLEETLRMKAMYVETERQEVDFVMNV